MHRDTFKNFLIFANVLYTLRQSRGEQRDIKDSQYDRVLCKQNYTLLFTSVDGSKLHLKYLVKILEKEMYESKDGKDWEKLAMEVENHQVWNFS